MRKEIAKRFYRSQQPVTVVLPDGTKAQGRGIISALDGKSVSARGIRGRMGVHSAPLWVYTGDCAALAGGEGATLQSGEERYTVLKAEQIMLGSLPVYLRAVLEKREAGHDGE